MTSSQQIEVQDKKIKITKEREFTPFHFLIYAARVGLEDAEKVTKEEKGISTWTPHELMAITFSAFALEAIGNSFGDKLIQRWKDFEYSSPIAKLRIVCEHLGVQPDFQQEPWASALWLISFRNEVAHAKPKLIKTEEIVSADNYFWPLHSEPPSKIEEQITLTNARRAVRTTQVILDLLYWKLKSDERASLFIGGFSGKASAC
jgi:hypothetical protein